MWQPKKKLQAKTTTDRLHKNFRGRLVAHEMNSIHFSHFTYKILHLLLQQPSSIQLMSPFVSRAGYGAMRVCLPLALETHYEYYYLKYFRSTKVDTAFI